MAKFKVNGQIQDFFEMANGHGHSSTLKIQNQRMAVAIHQKSKTGVGEWPWPFFMFEDAYTYVYFKDWISTLTRNSLKFYLGSNSRYYSDWNCTSICVPTPKIHHIPNLILKRFLPLPKFYLIQIHRNPNSTFILPDLNSTLDQILPWLKSYWK